MINIQLYIKELLFDNNCVIIPSFGGFVTSYKPSEVHPIKHQFAPPSKHIAFNEKVNVNDGLLISYIANKANLSLQEATKIVSDFVNEIKSKLQNNEPYLFEGVGGISKNIEGNLQFKSQVDNNYLDDSFGLPVFFAEPIVRDNQNIKLKNKFKDRKAMSTEEVKKEEKTKKKGGATIWVLSIIAILLSFSAVYLYNTQNNVLSSILPASWFKSLPNNVSTEDTLSLEDEVAISDSVFLEEEETYADANTFEDETDYTTDTYENESNEVENTSSGVTFLNDLTGRYYVITGAFGDQNNAENLRDELIAKGYDAKVLSPLGKKPLFRVSIADYNTQQEGLDKASTENSEFGNTLWVLKY